jgi:transposase
LDVLHARYGGLDVHKEAVVACILWTGPDGREQRQVRSIGTTTAALLQLVESG